MNTQIINKKKTYGFKSKEEFLEFVDGKKKILIALNAEKLNLKDDKLDIIINNNIGYSDGIGAVIALKMKGVKSIKIAGAEFWIDIIKKYSNKKSFFFIGGKQETIEKTINKLKREFPKLNIVGYRNGYIDEVEKENLISLIKKRKPDVVFVAQGSPKQELLMDELIKLHPALYMGLGGSFDVYIGKVQRAPEIFIKLGLEWFYRLLREPSRFKRQRKAMIFFVNVLLKRI